LALFFVNVAYFEEAILKLERQNPDLKCILIVGSGINGLDASGVEMLYNLVDRLRASGIALAFSGMKRQVLDVMERTELIKKIGSENIFSTDRLALDTLRTALDSEQGST
jgi:SulP family sulfate permease